MFVYKYTIIFNINLVVIDNIAINIKALKKTLYYLSHVSIWVDKEQFFYLKK